MNILILLSGVHLMLSDIVRKTIEHTLNEVVRDKTNLVSIRIEESRLRILIFSTINGTFLNSELNDVGSALSFIHSLGLIDDSSIDYYLKNKIILDISLKEFLAIHEKYTVEDVSTCYNSLLKSEVCISNGLVSYKVQKDRRDMAGSYYTPHLLALNIVRQALKTYFEINPTSKSNMENFNMKIIDVSCGCGEFLLMCRKCLVEDYFFNPDQISTWFYGADIDPIAIQITVVRLYSGHEIPNRSLISSHFFIGNSLYNGSIGDDQSKFGMFIEGRFYSKKNGILEKLTKLKFDIIIGNPPWEKVRFEDRKFFRQYSSGIADITKKSEREQLVKQLKYEDQTLYSLYVDQTNDYASFKNTILGNGFLKESLCGELNTYALFTELSLRLLKKGGVCGLILKSALLTSPVYSPMFKWLMDMKILSSVYFFNNSNKIFDIDSREQFCVSFFKFNSDKISISFGLTEVNDFNSYDTIELTKSDIQILNPLTSQIPGIQSNEQMSILLEIHSKCPMFSEVFPECHYGRLVHLTSHSEYISTSASENNIPILEGKMIGLYTSHYSSFSAVSENKKYTHKAKSKSPVDTESFEQQCRFFIEKDAWKRITKNYKNEYSLYWRSLTSSTNSRTMIATIDKHMPSSQSVQLLQCDNFDDMLIILGIFNSSTFDKILRMKLCGIDLTQKIIKQMPVPSKESLMRIINFKGTSSTIHDHLIARVRNLLAEVIGEYSGGIAVSTDRYETMDDIDDIVSIAYST